MLSLTESLRQVQPQDFSEGRTIFTPSGTSGLLVPLGSHSLKSMGTLHGTV